MLYYVCALFIMHKIMEKITFKSFVIVVCLLSVALGGKAQYILTYSDGNLAHPVGEDYTDKTYNLSAAMYLTPAKLEPVKGKNISSVKVGLMKGTSSSPVKNYGDLTVAIRNSSDGEILATGTLSKDKITLNAWNEVILEQPLKITEKPLFISYTLADANSLPIAFDNNKNIETENATWLKVDDRKWEHNSGYGNVCIKAVVTGDGIPQFNAAFTQILAPGLVKTGEKFTSFGVVFNKGGQTINSLEVVLLKNDKELATAVVSDLNIASDTNSVVEIPDMVCQEEVAGNDVRMWVKKINGENLNSSDVDNEYAFSLSCTENCVARKILLEHFTSLPCSGCPAGLERLYNSIGDNLDRIAWVTHHNGAFTDEYMITESYAFIDFYGVESNTAPSVMFDRMNWADLGAMIPTVSTTLPSVGPVFTISYEGAVDLMKNILKLRLSEYSPIDISSIEQQYLKPGKLTITVKGKRLRALNGKPALSLFLTEDGLPGSPTHGDQDHVIRYIANSSKYYYWGDPIAFEADGSFSASYEIDLVGKEWNLAKVKVIAAVSNLDLQGINNNEVYNSAQVSLYDDGSNIDTNAVENSIRAYGRDGKIYVEGEYSSLEVYTIEGKRIGNSGLVRGVYVIKVMSNHEVVTKKVQL